jgi:copper transport protein
MKGRGRARTAGALGRLAVIVALLIAGTVGTAMAHAALRRADPPNGGRVPRPPRELRLEFTEAVASRTSRVTLVAPDSERFSLHVTGDSAMANVLVAHVPTLRIAGHYRVEWRLVGSDSHAVTGNYSFTVDSIPTRIDTATVPPVEERPTRKPSDLPGQWSIRFAASTVLVTVMGSVAFALFVLPVAVRADAGSTRKFRAAVDSRLHSLCVAGGWLLLALGVVRLVSQGASLSGSMAALSFGDLGDLVAGSTFGRGWLLQMAGAVVLLLVLRLTGATRWRVLAGITVALAFSAALLGHPAAAPNVPLLAIGIDAAHILGAGGWAGAILVMSIAVLPQVVRVPADHKLLLARNLLRAFSPLALTCAAVLVVTGAASAWLQLRDLGLLFDSPYGVVLVRKVVVVLLMAALGAYHWRVAQPSMNRERSVVLLRRSIAFDLVLVLLVLVLTAFLTGTAPPTR